MKVFYQSEMVPPFRKLYSPSPFKPSAVLQRWLGRFGGDIEVTSFSPATRADLYKCHTQGYVDGVLDGKLETGFYTRSVEIAESCLFTTGSMIAAARYVLSEKARAAVSPTSGFHHARYSSGGGFCTFNGLMAVVTALPDFRIGIVDCDYHYGDGTDDIIHKLRLQKSTRHYTQGRFCDEETPDEFLTKLPHRVRAMKDCDLVLYQAGADPHVHDPLGGWLTTTQLLQRDLLVFETLEEMGVPVVWNLAGGYQRGGSSGIDPVLEIHENTMMACLDTFA